MDTRFWGPSGWCLFHLIAAVPTNQQNLSAVREWFSLMEFVLPCKYCRASFHDYTKLQPLKAEILGNRDAFSRWMYDIHNRVNAKLRGQGLLTTRNPSWSSVRDKYYTKQASLCSSGSGFIGWDFLTSIAYSTPDKHYKPVPMPDTPEDASVLRRLSLRDKNRYNLLTGAERLSVLRRWWSLIPSILPCEEWRSAWSASLDTSRFPSTSASAMSWIWKMEKHVCAGLRCPTPHPSQPVLEREVSAFESNCGRTTCRTRKHRQRRRVLSQRQKRVQQLFQRDLDTQSQDTGVEE